MSAPTLKEELDRKSVESLQWLMSRYEDGEISAEEYLSGLDTFNMVTLGLIDRDISSAVTQEAVKVMRNTNGR